MAGAHGLTAVSLSGAPDAAVAVIARRDRAIFRQDSRVKRGNDKNCKRGNDKITRNDTEGKKKGRSPKQPASST